MLSLQLADKWRNQAICCCTEPAQNRHRTAQNSRPPPQHPFTYTPFSPKVAPKRATQPPAPRINSTKSFLRKTKEKNKTDSPTTSKWQIGLFLWQKAARREPERSAASAKRAVTPHRQVQGRSPWRAFGDFPRDGKVTRGGGAERPLMGVGGPPAPTSGSEEPRLTTCSRGAAPLASVAAGATSPAQTPGRGAERLQIVGTQGPPPLHHPPPLSKDSPLIQKRTIFIHKFMLYCFCQKSYSPQFR